MFRGDPCDHKGATPAFLTYTGGVNRPGLGDPPAQLGRYQLLTPIASGGMAQVYVGRALGEGGFQRLVAIKRILPGLTDDPRFVDMFLDEGRIAGLITSPHVVQVLDVARTKDNELLMVLELIRGVALHEILRAAIARKTRIPVPVLVGVLAQAADGLAAAHEATSPEGVPMNIVHRDVSPQNILVGEDGRARLADFGVARALHRRTSTQNGELRGKLGYFAPEQVRGQPATVRSDLFSLGVVAWECLAGERLFRAATPLETLREIRTKPAPPLHIVRDDVPAALAACVDRALAKTDSVRFASARELASALRESVEEATPTEIARVVRDLAGDQIRALDDKIRAALVEGPTTPRLGTPASAGAARTVDLFQVDSDTTTQLVTPSDMELSASDLEPVTDMRGTERRRAWLLWFALGLGAAALLGIALAASVPTHRAEPAGDPVAQNTSPAATTVPEPAPTLVPPVEAQPAAATPATPDAPPAPVTEPREPSPAPTLALSQPEEEPVETPPPVAPASPEARRRRGLRSTADFARALEEVPPQSD